jgi:hypothetical protein
MTSNRFLASRTSVRKEYYLTLLGSTPISVIVLNTPSASETLPSLQIVSINQQAEDDNIRNDIQTPCFI